MKNHRSEKEKKHRAALVQEELVGDLARVKFLLHS
jgi:hypothetical protein